MGQWGVRGENDLERISRRKLEEDLEGSPLLGNRLRQRLRNFRPSVAGHLLSLGGPLPYMTRLREIEHLMLEHEHRLRGAWREAASACGDDFGRFERVWRRRVERWDFSEVNDLIDRHNRYYPAEARLPMDVRRRDFVLVNGRPYSRRRLDATWALERFPADAAAAISSARFDAAVPGP